MDPDGHMTDKPSVNSGPRIFRTNSLLYVLLISDGFDPDQVDFTRQAEITEGLQYNTI